jgi:hypothetical protein
MANDDLDKILQLTTGGAVSLAAVIGGIVSMCNNPFIAEAGFVKGVFAHYLVGAGTGIGAGAFGLIGGLGAGAAGFIAGGVLGAVGGRSSGAARSGGAIGLVVGGLASGVWGGIQGYDVSNQMLNNSVKSYKTAAIETNSRAASPVRLVQEGNKVVAYISRPVLGG